MKHNRSRRKSHNSRSCKKVALDSLLIFSVCSLLLLIIGTNFYADRLSIFECFGWLKNLRIEKNTAILTTQSVIHNDATFEYADVDFITSLDSSNLIEDRIFLKNSSNVPAALLEARKILDNHPFKRLPADRSISTYSMEDAVFYLHNQRECKNKPIFISMAQVKTDLYWQLIENFVYTMVKFSLSDCSVMICVTDKRCMDLCKKSGFPCYYFGYDLHNPGKPLPSALEQIANLKLLHLPKALSKGVDMLMLDLDVGFLDSPMKLIDGFFSPTSPLWKKDILVQEDITFIMHRSVTLWRTWYTESMPNIGLLLIRGNAKTKRMFNIAWRDYQTITKNIKQNPGKDQNKVVAALRILTWDYFPKGAALLLDKMYKFDNKTFELGGEASDQAFRSIFSYIICNIHKDFIILLVVIYLSKHHHHQIKRSYSSPYNLLRTKIKSNGP
jgi:hypothetical protein